MKCIPRRWRRHGNLQRHHLPPVFPLRLSLRRARPGIATAVFKDSVVEAFARRAAAALRPGSRVVTLASPLRHARFRVERVVPCVNSWGDEDAFVNVVADDDDATLLLRLEVASSGTTRYTWT